MRGSLPETVVIGRKDQVCFMKFELIKRIFQVKPGMNDQTTLAEIFDMDTSVIVYDDKGEIYDKYNKDAKDKGFTVSYINMNNGYAAKDIVHMLPLKDIYNKHTAIFIVFCEACKKEFLRLKKLIREALLKYVEAASNGIHLVVSDSLLLDPRTEPLYPSSLKRLKTKMTFLMRPIPIRDTTRVDLMVQNGEGMIMEAIDDRV